MLAARESVLSKLLAACKAIFLSLLVLAKKSQCSHARECSQRPFVILSLNPRTYKGGGDATPLKVILSFFFQRIKHQHLTFSVAVRSSLAPILRQVQCSVMVSCYGYDI